MAVREVAAGDHILPLDGSQCDDHSREQAAVLYRDHASALRRRLRARLGSTDDANELLHDAFARLLGSRSLAEVRDPRAFLNRIISNLLIDRSRRRSARPIHVGIENEAELAVAPAQTDGIELEQVHRRYKELVDALPPRMRQVFLLHRVEGLGYKEIAERLDISVRTVEWHIAEAIVRIGKGLDRR